MNSELANRYFDYDRETGVLLWRIHKSNHHGKIGSVAGSISERGYWRVKVDGRSYMVHRIIWLMVNGVFPKEIDHINGIRTDNRLCNLREASRSQNCANKRTPSTNTSGFKGVSKSQNRWCAQIKVHGRYRHLGSHASPEDAAKAYAKAAVKFFGEFARP
ncbi:MULTISPECIES: HNH endonuclease signature motif containing protein [unclassified Rhodanobacter]|uniref:HNH endonuclease signature motif containing protein n=1 Tax=unclassified Rhodanobacter TaxID=2621553 RepID=UPI000B2A7D86|nr:MULTISPECIES: HNH endonuclease signature motif containing protein [unclassified Rhodanobacter]